MRKRKMAAPVIGILLAGAIAMVLWPTLFPSNEEQAGQQPTTQAYLGNGLEGTFTLAVNWQPAFCETRPDKRECESQTAGRFDAENFSLHGLWPEGPDSLYCGVSDDEVQMDKAGRWQDLEQPELSPTTRDRLNTIMPGTQSQLDRHEWIKHGTCANSTAEDYYATSLALMDGLNATPVRTLFDASKGQSLTAAEIRATFDDVFGKGAGARVGIDCVRDGDRTLIAELRIGLEGKIGAGAPLGAAILAASPRVTGCPSGIIDTVGLQ